MNIMCRYILVAATALFAPTGYAQHPAPPLDDTTLQRMKGPKDVAAKRKHMEALLAEHQARLERIRTLPRPVREARREPLPRAAWVVGSPAEARARVEQAVAGAVASTPDPAGVGLQREAGGASRSTAVALGSPEEVPFTDTWTPWLCDRLQEATVWRVPISLSRSPRTARTDSATGAYLWQDIRDGAAGEAIVDPSTGEVVRIVLRNRVMFHREPTEPPAQDFEDELWAGFEVWTGRPASPPRFTLVAALDAIGKEWGSVDADKIIAQCVMVSREGQPAHAVWSVHRLGTMHGGAMHANNFALNEATRHERHMFNAETGASEGSETWAMKHWQKALQGAQKQSGDR